MRLLSVSMLHCIYQGRNILVGRPVKIEEPPRRVTHTLCTHLKVCGGSPVEVGLPYKTVAPRGRCNCPTKAFLIWRAVLSHAFFYWARAPTCEGRVQVANFYEGSNVRRYQKWSTNLNLEYFLKMSKILRNILGIVFC